MLLSGTLPPDSFHGQVEDYRRRLIVETLARCGGNQTRAAEALRLQRTYLARLIRQLGKGVTVNAEGDLPAKAVADLFPAYDDDGGLLLVLTPSK